MWWYNDKTQASVASLCRFWRENHIDWGVWRSPDKPFISSVSGYLNGNFSAYQSTQNSVFFFCVFFFTVAFLTWDRAQSWTYRWNVRECELLQTRRESKVFKYKVTLMRWVFNSPKIPVFSCMCDIVQLWTEIRSLSFLMWPRLLLGFHVHTPASFLKVGVCVCVSLVSHTHQMSPCFASSGSAFQQEINGHGFAFASRLMEQKSYRRLELTQANVLTSGNTFPWFKTYVATFK